VVGVAVAAAALLAACGGDDGGGPEATAPAPTTTIPLDPGVTFPEDAPTTTGPPASPGSGPGPGEVVSEPGEVPDGFPADFPVPEGAEVEVGTSGRAQGELRFAVDYRVDDDPAAVHRFYRAAVDEEGWAVLIDDDDGTGDDYVGQLVFESDTFVGSVLIAGTDGDTLLTLTATLPD
jgi:hypothetical protein